MGFYVQKAFGFGGPFRLNLSRPGLGVCSGVKGAPPLNPQVAGRVR
jgi:hypothetical protein